MFVAVDGVEYPCIIEGAGAPCIVVGLTSVAVRSISDNLKKHFRFYCSDLYWCHDAAAIDYASKDLESLADDIEKCRKAWGLDKIYVLSHSAPSFIALEYVRKYPDKVKGVVLVGSPVTAIGDENFDAYFEEYASKERKAQFVKDQEELAGMDLSKLSFNEVVVADYFSKKAKFFFDYTKDYKYLWNGVELNQKMVEHFYSAIKKDLDNRAEYKKLKSKILVAMGRYDYVEPCFLWDELDQKMENLKVKVFEKSGHYAMKEESEVFDNWILENFNE